MVKMNKREIQSLNSNSAYIMWCPVTLPIELCYRKFVN